MEERLQKAIASAGVASRRKAEAMITNGQVSVNGKIVRELGVKVTESDKIEVDGVPVVREETHTFLLYKPRGVVSTVSDEKGRKTVVDLLSQEPYRLYPVGRLDYDTSGALLMTNDGDLANKLMHPKNEIEKVYTAKVEGIFTDEAMKRIRRGIMIDGKKTAPARGRIISTDKEKKTSLVQITIHEGRYHQVKKMFAAVGFPVQKLSRERYAFLDLTSLMSGQYRELTSDEIKELKNIDNTAK